MRRQTLFVVAALLAVTTFAVSQSRNREPRHQDRVERGKYLADKVAVCGDCHTPRLADGRSDPSRWMHGTELDFQPTRPMPGWAGYAGCIAGLPNWKDEEAVTLLMTGKGPKGNPLRPPMPSYGLTREDAEAMVAYLKSLKPPAEPAK